jgi:choline-glycine betaine transporter
VTTVREFATGAFLINVFFTLLWIGIFGSSAFDFPNPLTLIWFSYFAVVLVLVFWSNGNKGT